MIDKDYILIKLNKLDLKEILNIYIYGSCVYGNNTPKDVDLIVVTESTYFEQPIEYEELNVTVISKTLFLDKIDNQEISILECLSLPSEFILQEKFKVSIKIDIPILRKSISHISDNSFVKAKKKFIVEQDYNPYIGKKSLFHSIRILHFGIQLATKGSVYDFKEANSYYNQIMSCNDDWNEIESKFKKEFKKLKTKFREVCPKNK